MSRTKTVFVCRECGFRSPKWLGRCSDCEAWSSLDEEVERPPAAAGERSFAGKSAPGSVARVKAEEIAHVDAAATKRVPTGLSEFDRCLGGGLVPGSLVLLGGEPGIGKSTLLLQVSDALSRAGKKVLYVTGEESPAQVRLRSERLQLQSSSVLVLGETDVDAILSEAERLSPAAIVIDSIQVVRDNQLASAAGTVSQVKQAADRLLRHAKETGTTVLLIGHVTKDGALAGPRTLEHVVDTVLTFESEGSAVHRLVRAVKNRFGPSGEVGVFEMKGTGLAEVPDASRLFLSERRADLPGSAVCSSMEGTRAVLVEVQALASLTTFPQPKRMAVGVDSSRLAMLLAVLDRRANQPVGDRDVFINVAGGLRLRETAADLAVAVAIVSSLTSIPVPEDVAVFGELGLTGEVRSVDRAGLRLKEARSLGFGRCLVARGNVAAGETPKGLTVVPVADIVEVITKLFGAAALQPRERSGARPEPPRPPRPPGPRLV